MLGIGGLVLSKVSQEQLDGLSLEEKRLIAYETEITKFL